MKIAALVTAAALACGAAYANTTADSQKQSSKASTAQTEPQGEGFAVKTKRAFKRMGDKLRSIGNKDTQQANKAPDTRTMGAGADTKDSAKRNRADESYSKSKSTDKDKQQK